MESTIKIGHKIQCIKDLKSFCNGEEKNIFIKDNIYDVVSGVTGIPCIRIRENDDGYSFINNSMDSYFKIIGVTDDVIVTKDNIHLYYEFMNDKDIQSNISIIETMISDRFNIIKNCINIENENLKLHLNFEKRTIEGKTTIVSGACGAIEIFGVKDTLMPIDEYINKIKSSNTFINFEKEKLINEQVDITNVVIIDFSEEEIAKYINRCIKYLNKISDLKYRFEIWETDEVYGQRDDEEDYAEEYQGYSMYQGKIAIYDGVFEKDIKFTGIYYEISAVFSDLLTHLRMLENNNNKIDK